jgi:1-acyl-sn-glycerol-3-phosphate acyltransferase
VLILVILQVLTVVSIFKVRRLTFVHNRMRSSENLPPQWKPFLRPDSGSLPPLPFMLILGTLTAPFRFIAIILLVLFASGSSWVTSPSTSLEIARFCGNLVAFLAGVSQIKWVGTSADVSVSPLVIANHISWIDFMVLGATIKFGFVMSEGVSNVPLIGPGFKRLAHHVGSIVLDRHSAKSREAAKQKIKERLTSIQSTGKGERLLIFSEGTLTNSEIVVPFKLGAFESLVPTQPLRLEFSNPHFSLACLGVLEATLFFLSLGRTQLTLTWGNVVHPTKDDTPETLARRVQEALVKGSHMKAADCGSYRDHLTLYNRRFETSLEQ